MTTKVVLAPEFRHSSKQLKKRFPSIMKDLNPVLIQLERGETPGDRIPGVPYRVYKVRLRNSDAKRGKSGGYRVIYYLETKEQTIILTIYSKIDQTDISAEFIESVIEEYEQ